MVGKPGTTLNIGRHSLDYHWRLSTQKPEKSNNMLRSIHNTVFHFYLKEHWEVNIAYKFNYHPKLLENLSLKGVL